MMLSDFIRSQWIWFLFFFFFRFVEGTRWNWKKGKVKVHKSLCPVYENIKKSFCCCYNNEVSFTRLWPRIKQLNSHGNGVWLDDLRLLCDIPWMFCEILVGATKRRWRKSNFFWIVTSDVTASSDTLFVKFFKNIRKKTEKKIKKILFMKTCLASGSEIDLKFLN